MTELILPIGHARFFLEPTSLRNLDDAPVSPCSNSAISFRDLTANSVGIAKLTCNQRALPFRAERQSSVLWESQRNSDSGQYCSCCANVVLLQAPPLYLWNATRHTLLD